MIDPAVACADCPFRCDVCVPRRLMKRMQHPNVISIIDHHETHRGVHIVMDYADRFVTASQRRAPCSVVPCGVAACCMLGCTHACE